MKQIYRSIKDFAKVKTKLQDARHFYKKTAKPTQQPERAGTGRGVRLQQLAEEIFTSLSG